MSGTATTNKPGKEITSSMHPGERIDFMEKYLIDKGWTTAGIEAGQSKWNDPKGTLEQPVKQLMRQLPTKGGGHENLYQTVGGLLPWAYPLEEAYAIQRSRDNDESATEKKRK